MLVLLLFFCSGATALIYEVIWSKYLGLMLGSTVQAQTVVLAVFMGGLALGNKIFGKRAETFREPLAIYGYLEVVIGLYAFFFYTIYNGADSVFLQLGRPIMENSGLLLLLKLTISAALLIIPTVLMGGTLPLLASWIEKQPGLDSSARVGIFYATNSLGAVTGAALAGFVLVQSLGMVSSVEITALCNVLIGLFAIILSKRAMLRLSTGPAASKPRTEQAPGTKAVIGWFGLLVAGTGGASMGLEVISSRALGMIVGSSLQAFALVLMSFILGIGIGSIIISSSKLARRLGYSTIYLLLLGAGLLVILNVIFIERIAMLYSQAKFGLAANSSGWFWHQTMVAIVAFLFLGIPAAFLGAVVPLSIRLLEHEGTDLGEKVGLLLTWNTLGAVGGVLLTGFVLMPMFRLRGALVLIALTLMGIVIGIAFKREHKTVLMTTALIVMCSIAAVSSTGQNWQHVLSAGIFRVRSAMLSEKNITHWKNTRELLFYKDAPDATVTVERSIQGKDVGQLILRINGKADASTQGDLATQMLLAHLPMMAKPDAKEVFVLGFGSGITAGALLGHPIERVTIAENCKPVLEAAHYFAEWNRGVLTNSRAVIRNDDARAVLKLGGKKYDVIISEPSNPWVVGVGSVFSQEFYQLAAESMTEDGIMAQWFHIYEMSNEIVMLVIRTFASVFPHMELWDTQAGDIVLLGSKKPWPSDPSHYQRIFERPLVRQDMERVHLPNGVALWMRQIASQTTAWAIAGDGPIQTDEFPILEYAAPKAFFIGATAGNLFVFDERVLQFPLASSQKLQVLRALPPQVVYDGFKPPYESSSADVNRYATAAIRDPDKLPGIQPLAQIAFRAPTSYPEDPVIPPDASPEYAELIGLEADLLRHPENWRSAAIRIYEIMASMKAREKRPDFVGGFYPALAAKFAMHNGDFALAYRLIRIGFMFSRGDVQLQYMTRVLDRLLPPDQLEELRELIEAAEIEGQVPAEITGDAPPEALN